MYTSGGSASPSFVYLSSSTSFITVDTSLVADVNTYTLEIIANVGTYYSTSSTPILFTLTVTNNCPSTVITPSSILDQTYTDGYSALIFTFPSFTDTYGYCGTYIYTTSTLDSSYVTFNEALQQFTVYTTDLSFIVTTSITVTGTLGTYGSASFSFNLNLNNVCQTSRIYHTSQLSQSY